MTSHGTRFERTDFASVALETGSAVALEVRAGLRVGADVEVEQVLAPVRLQHVFALVVGAVAVLAEVGDVFAVLAAVAGAAVAIVASVHALASAASAAVLSCAHV